MYDRMDSVDRSGVTACVSGMTSDISSRKRKTVGPSELSSPSRKVGKLREDDTRQSALSQVTTLSEGTHASAARLKGEGPIPASPAHVGPSPGEKGAGERAHPDHEGGRQKLGFDRLTESACQHAQERMYDQFMPFSAANEGSLDADGSSRTAAGASTYPGTGTAWHGRLQGRKDTGGTLSNSQGVSGITKQGSAVSKPGDTGSGISKPGDSGNATGLSDVYGCAQRLNADLSRSQSGTRSSSVSRPAYGRPRPGDEASSREEDEDLKSTGERDKGAVNASQWSQRSQPSNSSQEEDKERQSGELASDDSNRSRGSPPMFDSRRLAGLAQSIVGGKRSWRLADDDEDEDSGRDLKCLRLHPVPAGLWPDPKPLVAPSRLAGCANVASLASTPGGNAASLASVPVSGLHAETERGAEGRSVLEDLERGHLGPSGVVPKPPVDAQTVPDGRAADGPGAGAPGSPVQAAENEGGAVGPAGIEQTRHPAMLRMRRGGSPVEGHEALYSAARDRQSDSIVDVESSGRLSSYDNSMSDMQDGEGHLFVLSSGRLRRRQGAPPSRPRQPTIDDEFEQYFSQMLL